ncbi:MAG: phosphodiester glycosidase family protein [Limnochordales bacterium]
MKVSCPCGPQPPLAARTATNARRWHRWAGVALGLWLLLAGAAAAATGAPLPTPATVAASAPLAIQWEPIGPDTYHGQLVLYAADGAIQPLHIVRVPRDNPYIRFETILGQDAVDGVEPVLARALERHGPGRAVVAAVNADFFYSRPIAGLPVGIHLQAGELAASPSGQPAFGWADGGGPVIAVPEMQARVWLAGAGDTSPMPGAEDVPAVWAIDLINRPISGLALALYTPRLGPATPPIEGTAVVVTGADQPLVPGKTYSGTVAAREYGSRTTPITLPIPPDGVVLAARGPAEEFLDLLPLGAAVHWEVTLAPPFDAVQEAVGGRPWLIADGQPLPLDTRDPLVTQRHPRTAIGYNEREIFLVTVDGRWEGEADGMTLWELQEFLLGLGVTEALNLDGGGSTTMIIRPPGASDPQVVNRPSDGQERPVGNGLLVVSTAPPAELARLVLEPAAGAALVGSLMPIAVLGQDEHFGPRRVFLSQVEWTVTGDAGRMGAGGTFSARQPGTARIEAAVGSIRAETVVSVVDTVAAITVTPETVSLASGESITLQARAWDAAGRPVWANPWQFRWTVEGDAVRVDAGGQVRAVRQGEAVVTARLGDVAAAARITVDRPPEVLWGFDEIGGWFATAIRAQAALALSGPGEPVLAGAHAAKLTYDLRAGGGGTAAAYVQAPAPVPIPGRPRAIGLWVYGDGSGHWLRANYIDGDGNRRVTDFTAVGGLDWTGWRWVEAPIDPDAPLPILFERVYVVEFEPARQGAGTLYLDQLTALYGPARA